MLMPTAPPRFIGGYVDVLSLHAADGWWGADASAPRGLGGLTNELAAFPSLHAGWSLWVALALQVYATRKWVRVARLALRRRHRRRHRRHRQPLGDRRAGRLAGDPGRLGGRPRRRPDPAAAAVAPDVARRADVAEPPCTRGVLGRRVRRDAPGLGISRPDRDSGGVRLPTLGRLTLPATGLLAAALAWGGHECAGARRDGRSRTATTARRRPAAAPRPRPPRSPRCSRSWSRRPPTAYGSRPTTAAT